MAYHGADYAHAGAGLRQQEFVEAAISLGLSPSAIIFKHIILNAIGPIIVYTTLTIPSVMLLEAFLSFLGSAYNPANQLGTAYQLWGGDHGRVPMATDIPGLALTITLFSLNFLGDGLRDALDVRALRLIA